MRSLLCFIFSAAAFTGLAHAANGYTAMRVELSSDNTHWSTTLEVMPGSALQVRIVAGYEGRAQLHGLAWVNFQPTISEWWGSFDQVLPFITSGNQAGGAVAFDKPEGSQAAFGRVYPYAAPMLGSASGGYNTTLRAFTGFAQGTRLTRIAQTRTTNNIGEGPTSGLFAYNNTNGVGGIVCAQPSAEEMFDGVRNTLNQGIVLFKFGIVVDPTLTERNMIVDLPVGGISKFGQPGASAGWFTTASQSASGVSYVPVVTRSARIEVRGPIPSPGTLGVLALAPLFFRRRG